MSRFLHRILPSPKFVHLVGLNARGAAWLATSATGALHWKQTTWDTCLTESSASVALKSVVHLVDPSQEPSIAWVVAPSLARSWVQVPSSQIASLAELHAVAQARANQLFGGPVSPTAPSALWAVTADWHASRPFLCVASPSAWVRSLQGLIKGRKHSLILSPLTLALDRFQKQVPDNGWLAIAVAGELNIMHWMRGRMTRLRSMRLPIDSTPATAQTLAVTEWQREVLRTQNNSEHLYWLCLMPDSGRGTSSSEIRVIEWTPSQRLLTPPSLGTLGEFAEGQAALSEAMLTAWSGLQLLEGADL